MSGHRPVPARTSETVNHSGGKVTAMTDSLRNEQTVDENSRLSLKEVIWGVLFTGSITAALYFYSPDAIVTVILGTGHPIP